MLINIYVNYARLFTPGGGRMVRTDPVITELTLCELEVESMLKTLNINKAPGLMKSRPNYSKKLPLAIISPFLCKLLNKSLRLGTVPEEWKLENVVPVFKKGNKDHTENYDLTFVDCI